jgi:hypothetical protein
MEDSSGLTYFTWDENGMNLLCERDSSGAVTKEYTHGPTPVDGIGSVVEIEDGATGAFKYPHMDHRGTVFATTGEAEAQKDAYEWNA